ncbi:hypothetical protein GQ457_01G028540 [Hibiscus cannabinus]
MENLFFIWQGYTPFVPRILGHEASGIVESVGEGVTDLQPGDHVLPIFTGECKECRLLVRREQQQCQTVAIFGLGAVGLAAAEGARVCGASRIIAVDLNPKRFEEGSISLRKFGITEFVNPNDYNKPVQEVASNLVIVEMTGGGSGPQYPSNESSERKDSERCFYGNYKPRTDIPLVVDKYLNKELGLDMDKFITHSVPFAEINKAFDLMLKGIGLRCMIHLMLKETDACGLHGMDVKIYYHVLCVFHQHKTLL